MRAAHCIRKNHGRRRISRCRSRRSLHTLRPAPCGLAGRCRRRKYRGHVFVLVGDRLHAMLAPSRTALSFPGEAQNCAPLRARLVHAHRLVGDAALEQDADSSPPSAKRSRSALSDFSYAPTGPEQRIAGAVAQLSLTILNWHVEVTERV